MNTRSPKKILISYVLKGFKLVYMGTPKMGSLVDGHPYSICLDPLLSQV